MPWRERVLTAEEVRHAAETFDALKQVLVSRYSTQEWEMALTMAFELALSLCWHMYDGEEETVKGAVAEFVEAWLEKHAGGGERVH